MRSGTSYFNRAVFKKTVTRFWPLWAVYFIIWLIMMPLNGLMQVSAQAGRTIKNISYMIRFASGTVPDMAQSALWLSVVFGLLAAMAVLSHLYGARSANFFASLPVRREGMFLTQYLAGLAFLVVPNAAIALLTLLVEAVGGWVNLPALLYWLGMSCGVCFFFYSMAVFCGMFTGHILALPVFYGVFNVLGFGLWAMGTSALRNFYYGYSSGTGWGYAVARWCTPVWNLQSNIWSYFRSSSLVYDGPASEPVGAELTKDVLELEGRFEVGMYALVAVVLTVCAFLLYRARRMESAGDVVSVSPMKPVFKYGVAVCSGLFLGQATAGMIHMQEPGMMISMLVWAVAGYFVAQMLLDKSFRVFKKWKGAVAVAGVFVALFLVVGFDLTGYETRMPSPDQVENVHVYGLGAVSLGDSGDYMNEELTDPQQIELVMDLHRAAISQRDGRYYNGTVMGTSMDLVYQLKDGSTLSRYYTLWVDSNEVGQEGSGAWALQQLYNDRDLFWEVYGFAAMDRAMAEEGWWMEQARYSDYSDKYSYNDEYYYYDDPQETERYFYGKDAMALYDAVREDYEANRIGVRDLSAADGADTSRYGEREIVFTMVNGKGKDDSESRVRIAVQDTATSTLAALEALADDAAQ